MLLTILSPLLNFSQNTNKSEFTVSGKIIDASTKKPIEDATVIFKNKDSLTIKCGGITNAKGNFSINVEEGTYDASVIFISYQEKRINISTINRNFNIGTIELEPDTEYLDAIEIFGEKRAIEFKPNKIVFHVEKDINATGGVATDILNNIPSVSVDPEGRITVQGQGNVQVMINGKMSSLTKEDALKSLPAGSIQDIEVITNPGAKYKSSALSVINIILKKGQDEGLNASITTTAGYKDYYGGLVTLNNKTKSINFFTTLSFNHSNPITTAIYDNEYFENGVTTSFLNETSEFDSKNNTFYGTIGSDFYLSNNTTLTASLNFQNLNNNSNTFAISKILDANEVLSHTNDRIHIGKFENNLIEFIIDLKHDFKKEGQQLTTYITYTRDLDTFNNTISNTHSGYVNESTIEKNKYKNSSVELNFINPINEKSTFITGYYGEFEKTPFKYSGTFGDQSIDYSENINAIFAEFENQGDTFYYGLGLRAEFTNLFVDYLNLNTSQKKSFNELLPSVYLEYTINDLKSVTLSYSNKMFTPEYSYLQPFEQKYSATSSYIGNPDLNPIYINSANADYVYYGNKITFSTGVYFNRYKDYWEIVTYETGEQFDGIKKIIKTPENIGKMDFYGLNISTVYKATKNISFTGNINLYNYDQTGNYSNINSVNETINLDYNFSSSTGSFSLLSQIKIPSVFNFQANLKHNLISKGPYSTRKAYTYVSAGINKDLFKQEATISLTIDDLFKSNETNRDRFSDSYFSSSLIENKFRKILLSFTYRFNQSKKDRSIDFDRKENKPNY